MIFPADRRIALRRSSPCGTVGRVIRGVNRASLHRVGDTSDAGAWRANLKRAGVHRAGETPTCGPVCSPNVPGKVLYTNFFPATIGGTAIFGDAPLLIATITDIPTETVNGGMLRFTMSANGSASPDCSGVQPTAFIAYFNGDFTGELGGAPDRAVCTIPVPPNPPFAPFNFTNFGADPFVDFPAPGCGIHYDLQIFVISNFAATSNTTAFMNNVTVTVTEQGP